MFCCSQLYDIKYSQTTDNLQTAAWFQVFLSNNNNNSFIIINNKFPLLHSAREWEMSIVLGRNLQLPEIVLSRTLKTDVVIWSKEVKKIFLVAAKRLHKRKPSNYQQLVNDLKEKNGILGFPL